MPESPPRQTNDTLGWLASLAVHGVACVLMLLASFPDAPGTAIPALFSEPRPDVATDDLVDLEALSVDLETAEDLPSLDDVADAAVADPSPAGSFANLPVASLDLSVSLPTAALTAPISIDTDGLLGEGTMGRTAAGREALVASKGGSQASEVAVARGLKWLADHQNPDGTWSLVHGGGACRGRCGNNAVFGSPERRFDDSLRSATGLALLPFLGAGETHERGRYKQVVSRGLDALVRLGTIEEDAPGAGWMDSGKMYAHGLCAIVLAEAYSMTGDPALRAPAQAAVDFIAYAQDPQGGGWRYEPQTPGDTSVTGWQVMALKSASLAGLSAPGRVARRAERFLDAAGVRRGARYRYLAPDDPEADEEGRATRTLTAVGLLCRMYLGWDQQDPRIADGIGWIAERGPSENNFYYNYYAAQTLFHHTGGVGATWRAWNEPLREQLVAQQATRGHERGSWWIDGPHNDRGGRVYTTALATMTLEVYYRYLPLYQESAVDTAFPD